jgi:hypothetical protein
MARRRPSRRHLKPPRSRRGPGNSFFPWELSIRRRELTDTYVGKWSN